MPITPFNSLRNPYSVGQTYLKSDGSTITTGTGYAVIVRLNTVMFRRWEPCLPLTNPITFNCGIPSIQINENNVDANTPGLVDLGGSGIDASDWDSCCSETGHPNHASYIAFISFDDWANSDLSQIATNPATWQKDEKLVYKFETTDATWGPQANGATRATAVFSFSIIEVVDETMYNAGAGVPVDNTITSQYATYGEIPVGTIMATPGDPNCNGCTDLYDNLGIRSRQGLAANQNPGYFLESKGPQKLTTNEGAEITNISMHPYDASFSWPYLMYDQLIAQVDLVPSDILMLLDGFTSGWYFGKLWNFESIALQGTCESCRDPLALNYDQSTSPVFGGISSNNPVDPNNVFYTSKLLLTGNTNFQRDCEGAVFQFDNINDPINSSGVPGPLGNTDCCLYDLNVSPPSGSGSGTICPDNVNCGCMDTNAANFCVTCTEDCNNVTGGSDTSCCEYYNLWEICGAHGNYAYSYNNLAGTVGGYPNYINLTGNQGNTWNAALPNNPTTNAQFMTYLESFNGAPSPFQIGQIIQMRSMGNPGDWWCLKYHGPQPQNAVYYDNLAGGNAVSASWNSNSWWNTPPATGQGGILIMEESCEHCSNPQLGNESYYTYRVCGGIHDGEVINVINSWASDPIDHLQNHNPGNPNLWLFQNEIGLVKPNMSCTSCQQGVQWLLQGEVLNISIDGQKYCVEWIGSEPTPQGSDVGGWVHGIGPGTDNFVRIDPQNQFELLDIFDNCTDCPAVPDPCIQICTDPNSPSYYPPPWPQNACDCNSDPIGTQNPSWNDCCDPNPCDGNCNDPLANNYDPSATGCCGSGLGIGTPTAEFTAGICSGNDEIVNQPMSSAEFHQYLSLQANGITGVDVETIQYENMDSIFFGLPTPPGACVGPNGGFLTSFDVGAGYIPDLTIAADINPGAPNTVYTTWDSLLTQCIAVGVTGVTAQTTFDELNILLTAWNPNGAGIPVAITPPTNAFCQCQYATYAQNNDCCTYNWSCSPTSPAFGLSWPTPDSNSVQSNVTTQYNKKFGLNVSDINPRPESTFKHINKIAYTFPGEAYFNVPLRLSNFRNLGLHFDTKDGSQGWKGGKQPKISYVEKYPEDWAYAYHFMQFLTTAGADNIDLTTSYYKVKTNMVSLEGNFLNKKAKIITEAIPGGIKKTGLYNVIIPAGAITIPNTFKSVFPTMAGVHFKTWGQFKDELKNYGLPSGIDSWQLVSEWVIEKTSEVAGIKPSEARLAAPEFVESTMQWMVQSADGCDCYEDPQGAFADQTECETNLFNPSTGDDNCCACVYGCTDPLATNYNPLATCDDGSCDNCDPFIIRFCSDMAMGIEMYHSAYLGDPTDPQTCANIQALMTAWGVQNYWDIVAVNYMHDGVSYTYCVQWVDPSVQYYQDWLTANSIPNPGILAFPSQSAQSGNFTYTPNNPNVNSDSQCQFCFGVGGCTDPLALNYNQNCAGATVVPTFDDGCCQYCVYGCMDTTAGGFPDINGHGSNAVYDCNVSTTIPTVADACTYPCATGYLHSNFNPCATCDDGGCEQPTFHKWSACAGSPAGEFAIVAPGATWNDIFAQDWFYNNVGTPNVGETINTASGVDNICYEYKGTSETSPATVLTPLPQMSAWQFNEVWNANCTSCQCVYGCTDPTACNYDASATCDDGSCCNETGCMDPQAFNYCPTCCCDGPCEAVKIGCMDPNANNYDPTANTPCSDCCDYTVYGCTDINAINFDPTATINQTSATDPTNPCKYLDQCKRAPREFGSDPTKKLNVECEFANDVYKEYRKQRYGLSNYCGSDLPDHLHEKQICDWEDSKRPAYLSSEISVLATYEYPIVDGEPYWMDPARPAWTDSNCGLTSDVDIDIYFMYDCTSMGLAAIQQQRNAADDWIAGFTTPFGGQVYHVLVCGERWIDWATTIFTGVWNNAGTCGGKDSFCVVNGVAADHGACLNVGRSDAVAPTDMTVTSKFWAPMAWGNTNNKDWYSSAPLGYDNGPITHLGHPPALTKREVLGVFFADESANGPGTGFDAQPYHTNGCNLFGCTPTWPQATDGTGTAADGSDSALTACYQADYDKYIEEYKKHLAKGPLHKATMVIYPARPLVSNNNIQPAQYAFPLHALAAISSGNNTPEDGRYASGTHPNNGIMNLVNIESGNPYWDTPNPNQPASHTYGYGGLDHYGWNANVASGTFDADVFKADLESYWDPNKLKCDGSECIVANVVNQNNVAIPDYPIYVDGGLVGKTDEFGRLKFQIENAAVKTHHIINLCLCLETKGNCRQQQIKITVNEECAPECCVDPTGVSCETYVAPTQVFEGCTDPNASNYNPMAVVDDGTCEYCDPGITITETHVDATQTGMDDGQITATVSNGTLPYTYSWTGPGGYTASTAAITGLAGGVYTLTVTDANNCTNTIVVNLDQPPLIYGCMTNTTGLWPNINGLNQLGNVCSYPCTDDGLVTGTPEGYLHFNYDPSATNADTCYTAGCTDPNAIPTGPQSYCASCTHDCNMEPIGTNNTGWSSCCDLCAYGCTDPIAGNYDPNATCDDLSCVYYWECDEASYAINEILTYNYQLSNYNNGAINGVYIDTSCAAGFCDIPWFYTQLADYYSAGGNEGLIPSSEVTAVGDGSGANYMTWGTSPCPFSILDQYYSGSSVMPLLTIGGYTTENPFGPTAGASCYAQLQIATFGSGYVFPSWDAYVTWHNGSGGPNLTCAGSQIPVINPGQNFTDTNVMHAGINSGSDPYNPYPEDNWVYYTVHEPSCSGYSDCECNQVLTVNDNDGFPGTYPTQQECLDDVNTCCGSGSGSPIGGCIDNGYVDQHPDFATYGATDAQSWWDGLNAANISYSQNNNPMSICANGVVHEELVVNGGNGAVGTGMGGNYPVGIPALNYNPLATYDDGSCCYCTGCMDTSDVNYEQGACFDDPDLCGGIANPDIPGCMDINSLTYDGAANTHQPTACTYAGCLDPTATNYGTFAVNGSTTYTYQGTTYGLSDITAGCANCCDTPPPASGNYVCVSEPLIAQNPNFLTTQWPDGAGTIVSPTWQNRQDITIHYTPPWATANTCTNLGSLHLNEDNPNHVVYVWSNASNADLYKHFNDFYFIKGTFTQGPLGISLNPGCGAPVGNWNMLYQSLLWGPTSGGVGFMPSQTDINIPNIAPYFEQTIITGVYLVRGDNSGTITPASPQGGIVVLQRDYTNGDTTWATFRQDLINYGFDGTSANMPDVSGLDYYQAQQLIQNAGGTSVYFLTYTYSECQNTTMMPDNTHMCFQSILGTMSCEDCAQTGFPGTGGSCGTCL